MTSTFSLDRPVVELDPIWIDWPYARIRRELDVHGGRVNSFTVQLEYDLAAFSPDSHGADWRVVARFDHDAISPGGHDVTEEGLHLDIYRHGARYERLWGFPTLPAGRAMRYAEATLRARGARLISRFEQWHGVEQ